MTTEQILQEMQKQIEELKFEIYLLKNPNASLIDRIKVKNGTN